MAPAGRRSSIYVSLNNHSTRMPNTDMQVPIEQVSIEELRSMDKSAVEGSVLKELGIKSSFFSSLFITVKTSLVNLDRQKELLDHLEMCNIILNNEDYHLLLPKLVSKTR